MRTVDPESWSKKVKKPILSVARPMKFGLNEVSNREVRLRSSFHDAMAEFLRNCSVEGLGVILDKRSRKSTRSFYIILLLVTMIFGLFVLIWNINWFWRWPRLMVNLQSIQNPIQKIDFPAIAICSYNIISRSGLHSYAKYLHSLDKINIYTIEDIERNLLAFGALHSRTFTPFDFGFVKYLKEVAHVTNITDIMYKLSPKCESMLLRCSWRARQINCLQLFATRITNLGFCCVFNSRYSRVDRNKPPHKVNLVGQDAGLTVVVRQNTGDFTSVRRLGDGVEVLLFDGTQFPMVKAGIIRTYSADRNTSTFLKINARAQEASSSLFKYSDEWLGCNMIRGEVVERSWSWCVGQCRARAALALCQCVPHMVPPLDDEEKVCSLEHLACLAKHKEKFTFLFPGDSVHESLSEEQEDSVSCMHCRVGCERKHFSAELVSTPHTPDMFLNRFFKGLDLTNTSIISIFYGQENQRLYLVEPGLRWYEGFAFISSQCVFAMGLTVVGVLEFVYHVTFRWYHHYMRHWRRDRRLRKLKKPTLKDDFI